MECYDKVIDVIGSRKEGKERGKKEGKGEGNRYFFVFFYKMFGSFERYCGVWKEGCGENKSVYAEFQKEAKELMKS